MEGVVAQDDAKGEYRDHGRTMCFNGKCSVSTDASGPFFNPTFWGDPKVALRPGMSWKVRLTQPWELGPAGEQTVTVLVVDPANDTVVLQREGDGDGGYRGAPGEVVLKRGVTEIHAAVKRSHAHWLGKAVFRHGFVVSDELLCDTAIELSSPELGTIAGRERQYMSVVEHPGPIAL
jgi:hypothetical protein